MPSEGMLKVGGGWELAFAKVVKALKMHKNFCFLFYMSEKLRKLRKLFFLNPPHYKQQM